MHLRSIIARSPILLVTLIATAAPALAQKKAAHCTAVEGALLMAGKAGTWESIAAKSDIGADRLLVAMFGADVSSLNGAVDVKLVADVGQRGPFASLETRVRFHAAKDADLDMSLERGIVVLSNKKKAGSAKVALRIANETFEVVLHDAKSRVGIEVHGRHLPGPPKLKALKDDVPVVTMLLFALQGEAVVATGEKATRLQAPPGAALFLWDSVSRTSEVQRFEKLPDFAKPFDEKERKLFETMCGYAKEVAGNPGAARKILQEAVGSPNPLQRKTAVVAMGALDDLNGLLDALGDAKHADVRDTAVLVARHWVGRDQGQSHQWYDFVVKQGYTPTQAKNMLHLLNGIAEEKRRQPATYDILIQGLNHSKAPMRELARWHLVRLVHGGDKIAYDAAAPEAQRLQAIAEWRRLVPEGELPVVPTKKAP
jgi:hypothetical protein